MKIGMDLKPFYSGSKYRGIGVYVKNLIAELLQLDLDSEFHFLNLYGEFPTDLPLDQRCFVHSYNNGPTVVDCGERNLYRVDELDCVREAQVRNFLNASGIQVMLFTSPNEYGNMYRGEWFKTVRTVAIVYDVIPLHFPEQCLFDPAYKEDYMRSLEFLKQMDLLLAISQSTRDEVVRHLGLLKETVKVISSGINSRYLHVENQSPIFEKEYFLFAGGIDFKKNIEAVIRAYSTLPPKHIRQADLVIVGKAAEDQIGRYRELAASLGVDEHIHCVGFVSDEDLIRWYCGAKALVFPSLYEGFGLPVIEAMACGTPVITSNNSSLKEIAEGHALLVDPRNPSEIRKAMAWVLNRPEETRKMAESAIPYARQFTWTNVAQKAYDAIRELTEGFEPQINQCSFRITDGILRAIAREYSAWNINLSPEICRRTIEELWALEKNIPVPASPGGWRIFYDVTVVREWAKNNYITGIGRVSLCLYRELRRIASVTAVCTEDIGGDLVFHPVNMDTYEVAKEIVEPSEGDFYFMPEFQVRGVQIPKNYPHPQQLRDHGILTYAVIHDILPLQFPEYFEEKTAAEFYGYLSDILADYDGILTVSKAVSDDIIAYLQSHVDLRSDHSVKLGYFHNGADRAAVSKITSTIEESISAFFKDDVFLMVGTIEPRKGHALVLNAFDTLWKEGFQGKLCIIGHIGWDMQKFVDLLRKHKAYGNKLIFLEGASDNVLQYAYQHSCALIQASAGEGFGLPLIEAGNYGLPVICSDIPVFREVAGEYAIYFDRSNPESLPKILDSFRDMRAKKQIPNSREIKSVSWQESARRIANIMLGDAGWYKELVPDGTVADAFTKKEEIFYAPTPIADVEEDWLEGRKTILIVHPNNFLRGGQGENNRTLSVVRMLKEIGYDVDLFSFEHFSEDSSFADFDSDNQEGLIRNLFLYDFHKGYKKEQADRRKYSRNIYLHDWTQPEMRIFFEDVVQKQDYAAVGIFYTYLANLIEDIPVSSKKIYFMEDCTFLQQYSWGGDATIGQIMDEELKKVELFDEILCISYDEKVMYEKLTGHEVYFLPHLMPEGTKQISTPLEERKWDILFLGANNPFNVEGLQWFVDEVCPLLGEDFRIVLVGAATKGLTKVPDCATVIPFAPDLDEIYENTRIAVCPMFRGTGMKIKVVEAMAHGLPVVCNERGIDGFPDKLLSGCLVTNDPDKFAGYLTRLIQDQEFYEECSHRIQSYFQTVFARDQYADLLSKVLDDEG